MIQDVKLKQQALFFKMLLHNINLESAFGEYYTSNNDLNDLVVKRIIK